MTAKEAIKALEYYGRRGTYFPPEKRHEAIKLGIEALKLIRETNDQYRAKDPYMLPGETKQ